MLLKDLKIEAKKEIAIKDVELNTIFKIQKLEIKESGNVYHAYETINGNEYFYRISENMIDDINFKLVRI